MNHQFTRISDNLWHTVPVEGERRIYVFSNLEKAEYEKARPGDRMRIISSKKDKGEFIPNPAVG
jgi:hypothetical protein